MRVTNAPASRERRRRRLELAKGLQLLLNIQCIGDLAFDR